MKQKFLKKVMAVGMTAMMCMSFGVMPAIAAVSNTATDWTASYPAIFTVADNEEQSGVDDQWEQKVDNGDGKGIYENTTTTTKITVQPQEGSLKGETIKAYQLLITDGETDGKKTYEVNPIYKEAITSALSLSASASDIEILDALGALVTKDSDNGYTDLTDPDQAASSVQVAFSNALHEYIVQNGIAETASAVGTGTDVELNLSRQYTYDGSGTGTYSRGRGYYMILRSGSTGDQYFLKDFNNATDTVHVKGKEVTLTKTGDDIIMNVGQTVGYKLETTMVDTNGDGTYKYVIVDQLEKTLSAPEADAITVKYDAAEDGTGGTELTKDKDYTVAIDDSNPNYTETKITFSFAAGSALEKDALSGHKITVLYSSKVLETATSGNNSGNENYNKAWLEYADKKTTESEHDVYTTKWVLNKLGDGQPLDGAKFTVAKDGKTLTFTEVTDGSNTYYYYDPNVTGSVTDLKTVNGKFEIRGLDDGTYTVTETEAPNGFQKVSAFDLQVVAGLDTATNKKMASLTATPSVGFVSHTEDVGEGLVDLTITDPRKGSDNLPATGGTGRIWVYVIGSMLLIFAVGASVVSRKKED
ncbi:MAG: SpaA isopeptide-forming pilin-related protein [Lachnospiraceae bacterium]